MTRKRSAPPLVYNMTAGDTLLVCEPCVLVAVGCCSFYGMPAVPESVPREHQAMRCGALAR